MITMVVRIRTKPAEHDRFVAAARVLRAASVAEEGNVEYSLWEPSGGGDEVLVVERWQDQAAMDAHHDSAHLAAFRAAVKGALAEPPTSFRADEAGAP